MKKALLIFLVIILSSCSKNTNTVEISGKVIKPIDETISILLNNNTLTDSLKNGQFKLEIELEKAQYASFKHGKETTLMYIKPGDRIQLSIDPTEFDESIRYTGSSESNFLAKKYLLNESALSRELYAQNPDSFLLSLSSYEKKLDQSLKLCTNNKFVDEQKSIITFELASTKINYPQYHKYLTETDANLSSTYYDFIKTLDINNELLLEHDEYTSFLMNYVYSNAGSLKEKFSFISENFDNIEIKNHLSYTMFKEYLNYESVDNVDSILVDYKTLQTDTEKYSELADLATEMKRFQAGNKAFDFSYPNTNGDTVSLSNFIGSYVYVDVWATWCAPCKREIPFLKELEHDYAGKNIVFMGVSVDEDTNRDAWLEMIEEKEMGGIQLFASGWSKITKDYKINGIPRFMLFDPQGNIVNVRATRPSNPETRILFDLIL